MQSAARASSITHEDLFSIVVSERSKDADQGSCSVLDVGCGSGEMLAFFQRAGAADLSLRRVELYGFDVTGAGTSPADFPAKTVERLVREDPAQPWPERIRATGENEPWPFDDGHFDFAVSNQVLEHVEDLDHFLAELRRVLRPGGRSFHLFPLRHYLVEGHTQLPLVHRFATHDARRYAVEALTRVGFGARMYSVVRDERGASLPEYAESTADFIAHDTWYRSWREIARAGKRHGLRVDYRYTGGLYLRKAASILNRPLGLRYAERSPMGEWLAFMICRYLQGVTVSFDRSPRPHAWRG